MSISDKQIDEQPIVHEQQKKHDTTIPAVSTSTSSSHPVAIAMSSILPRLQTLPVPPAQAKDLAPVFNIHNAIRRSILCIPAYLSNIDINNKSINEIQIIAKDVLSWVKWYLPHLHHHHHLEDDFWFPAYRRILVDTGVAADDVNTVFDRWESEHKALDEQETKMTRDLDALIKIKDDTTQEQIQQLFTAVQQSTSAFGGYIDQHLISEEQYWVEQFITQNRVTDEQCKQLSDTFVKTHLKKMKPKELGRLLGFAWSPLGKEKEQVMLKSILPLPVRCYYNWFARPAYLKQAPRLYLIAHGHLQA